MGAPADHDRECGDRIIQWDGRDIRLSYEPRRWSVIDHLAIQSVDGEPMPISETGYKSHYFGPCDPILSMDEVIDMVREWMDEEATKPAWKNYVIQSRQLSLF